MTDTDAAAATRCLNCAESFRGAYCPRCGQAAATGRLRLKEIARDAVGHFFSLDSQTFRTVVGLTRDPGRVCVEYVRGRRVGYVAPLRYFLTLIAASLLLNLALGFDPGSVTPSSSLSATQAAVRGAVAAFAARHLDLAILAILPLFVGVLELLFRKAARTYAEVGVLVLFVLGQVTFLGLALTPLKVVSPPAALGLKVLLQAGLFTWASTVFFRVSFLESLVKNILATAVYFVLVAASVLAFTLPRMLEILRGA